MAIMRQFKPGQLQTGSIYPITASYALTASYLSGSISIDTGSLVTTASFNAFTASYTTGSFTGSFKGDGSQLTGIVSSKWTGSNPISRQSDVEITGSLRITGQAASTLLTIGTNALVVTGSRIGIGTTTPVDAVEIVGPSKYIKINGVTDTDRSAWIGNDAVGTGNVYLFNGTNSNTIFLTGNGSSFFNGGNIGIGIGQASISASLHISGTNSSNLFRIDSPSTPNILFVTGSGRIGIGTVTPNARLDISGSAIITGSLEVTQGITGSLHGTASWATNAVTASYAINAATASYVSSNFQYEIHVSQIDGNDTTGNGDLLKPVATIGKALLIVSASVASTDRRTIIVHPGTYIENITVNTTNTYFFSTGLLGANCLISGSVTVSAATRMSGLKMTNLIVSSSAPVYINNCAVDKQMTVSGSGYLEVQNTSLQCTSGIQVVGPASSGVIFENCSLYPLTVNNASAAVYIISCNQAITPTLTAGALTITRSTISSLTSGATSTALTTAAGSVLVLESCNVYNSLLTSHAAITANGFYSIKNIIYNRSASTLASLSGTGGPLATVTQFQYINADNINSTQGLTVTGSILTTGSITLVGNQTITGSLTATSFTGSLFGTASWASNAVTAQTASYVLNAVSASFATTASYVPPSAIFPYTGSALITGSLGITGSLSIIDGSGTSNLNTNVRTLYGTNGSSSIDWSSRQLNAVNGSARLDWRTLNAFDTAKSQSIDWGSRILSDTSQTLSVNWSTRLLTDTSAITAVDWNSRTLRDSSGSGSLSADWRNRLLHDTSTSQSLDWSARALADSNESASLNWSSRTLSDSGAPGGSGIPVTSINWENRLLHDTSTSQSLDWSSRMLYDGSGVTSTDWSSRMLYDQTAIAIIDYSGGSGYNIRNYRPTVETLDLTVQDEFTQTNAGFTISTNTAGNIIEVGPNVDLAVTASNPVFLDTDGIWKRSDQTTDTTTKLLGICVNGWNKGTILTEGIITVTTASGYGDTTPFVSGSSFYGMPVYLTGSAAAFTTTKPTSGYVRVVGHMYYNSTTTPDYWIMKFNPSNDWYEI